MRNICEVRWQCKSCCYLLHYREVLWILRTGELILMFRHMSWLHIRGYLKLSVVTFTCGLGITTVSRLKSFNNVLHVCSFVDNMLKDFLFKFRANIVFEKGEKRFDIHKRLRSLDAGHNWETLQRQFYNRNDLFLLSSFKMLNNIKTSHTKCVRIASQTSALERGY